MNEIERVARVSLIDELALAIDQFLTHQVERDTLACDLTQDELAELAMGVAAIAAMRGEPVAWVQEHERGERVLSWKAMTRGAEELGWTETPLYAWPATDAENQRLRAEVDALREALEQIAMNNWRDQTRAKFVARAALTRYVCEECRWTYATSDEAARCKCPSLEDRVA